MQERHVSYRLFPPIFVSTQTQSKIKKKISVLLDYCALIDASEWRGLLGGGGVEKEKRTFSLPQPHERLRGEKHEVVRGLQLRRGEVCAEGQRADVRREVRLCARALRRGRELRRRQDEAP